MHFKLAYLKLTFFYVIIAMAISISFSVAIYNISLKELNRGLNNQAKIFQNGFQPSNPNSNSNDLLTPNFNRISQNQLDKSTNNLEKNLIYFNILIMILASGAGYLLALKTLDPIKKSMEAQNRFTADASHELRTPLTAMKTEIEVNLRDKDLSLNNAKSLLLSNLEEISKLEDLSSALLKLARSEDSVLAEFNNISVKDAVIEAYEKVEILAEEKSIKFETNFDSFNNSKENKKSVELEVFGDKQSLVELFVILIENAIKYSPRKSEILLSLSSNANSVIVKVKDQGIGIKACDLPYIFDRFYRSDTSRSKEKVSGYGLGLSIAKNIINLHRGNINVKSNPGQGSEFIIKFPLAK